MSNFDDHNQRWNDELFSNRKDGPYGGLSYGEVVSNPTLARIYGLDAWRDEQFQVELDNTQPTRGSLKIIWYLVLAEAVAIGLILFFTFMF
jgi:hypothetical protein